MAQAPIKLSLAGTKGTTVWSQPSVSTTGHTFKQQQNQLEVTGLVTAKTRRK